MLRLLPPLLIRVIVLHSPILLLSRCRRLGRWCCCRRRCTRGRPLLCLPTLGAPRHALRRPLLPLRQLLNALLAQALPCATRHGRGATRCGQCRLCRRRLGVAQLIQILQHREGADAALSLSGALLSSDPAGDSK